MQIVFALYLIQNALSHQSEVIYPKLKGFQIGHLNITSLTKHIEELRIFIHENSFEILCINETRFDNSIYDTEIEIAGYEIVRKDRNWNGGGVAIYLRNNIPYVERGDLTPVNVEAICLEIKKPKSKPVLIPTWYCPPDSKIDLFDRFEKFIQEIDNENKEMIITGDFNCDMLSNDNNNPNVMKLKDVIDIYQLQQHINNPTRVPTSTKTLVDLILTRIDDTKAIDSGVMDLGISNHNLIYIRRKVGIPGGNPKLMEIRQFKHFNTIKFQNNLREAFSNFGHHTDPNIAWHEWKEIFLHIADHHAPLRLRKVKSEYKSWLTNEIKNLSYRRDYLKKKAVSLNSPAYHEAYKKCRNQVNRLIKDLKTKFYKINLQNSTNSKDSWKIINELLNKKSKNTTINEIITIRWLEMKILPKSLITSSVK